MILNIIIFLSIIAVSYFQMLQGAYSALIMALLSTVAVCITFEMYDWASSMLQLGFMGGYEYGTGFMLTFALTMTVLRLAADYFCPANMYFWVVADRSIAALFGLYSGLIVAGMMAIGLQMLPFGPAVLGYDRVGILGEPAAATKEVSRVYGTFQERTSAMAFTVEDAAGITRSLWLSPDEFTFGIYRRILLDNGLLASGRTAPKNAYGKDIDANEFLARCWDWRVQQRFGVSPIGLRVPIWSVADRQSGHNLNEGPSSKPLLFVRFARIGPQAYKQFQGAEPPSDFHVLVSVQIPRGAGTKGWYLAPQTRGGIAKDGFPKVVPPSRSVVLDAPDPAEFAAFAYWQVRLDGTHKDGTVKSFPLRGVLPVDISVPDETAGPAKGVIGPDGRKRGRWRLGDEWRNLITNSSNDRTLPSGNIAVVTYPADERMPLQFRLLFLVTKEFTDRLQLVYTAIPPDTRDLADKTRREKFEFKIPDSPRAVGTIIANLADRDVVPLPKTAGSTDGTGTGTEGGTGTEPGGTTPGGM